MVINGVDSSLLSELKEKKDQDTILLELELKFLKVEVIAFENCGDGILRCQGRLCVPIVYGLQERIMEEAHRSRHFIHPGSKIFCLNFRVE